MTRTAQHHGALWVSRYDRNVGYCAERHERPDGGLVAATRRLLILGWPAGRLCEKCTLAQVEAWIGAHNARGGGSE